MKDVLALAVEHPDGPLLLTDILDLSERVAFYKDYEVPSPEDVVQGQLLKWRPKTGEIVLRYEGKNGKPLPKSASFGDFVLDGDLLFHPVLFQGSYSIELSGKSLEAPNMVFAEWRWDRATGTANGAGYAFRFDERSFAFRVKDGELETMDDSTATLRFGRRFFMKVQVSSKAIQASMTAKRLFKVKREEGPYGQFALSTPLAAETVEIRGEVDPAWIEGLIDARIQADYGKFCRSYNAMKRLPASLAKRVGGETKRLRDYWYHLPNPDADENQAALAELAKLQEGEGSEGERIEAALAYLKKVRTKALSEAAGPYVEALLHLAKGKRLEAIEQLLVTEAKAPSFFEARWLRLNLEYGDLEKAEAESQVRAIAAAHPEHADPWELLAQLRMSAAGVAGAREMVREALSGGFPASGLARVTRTISRAEHGPAFREPAKVNTKNFTVVSDLGERTANRVGRLLEDVYKRYNTRIRRVSGDEEERMQVCYFSGQAGYSAYCDDLLGDPAESTLGLYSPTLKQLLVWSNPDPVMTDRTIRHEGFHQYFDRLVGDSPIWLNEGLAESVEQARFERGRWTTDHVNEDHLAVLRRYRWTPCEDFVRMAPQAFRTKVGLHYAQAWALVHFLENGGRPSRGIMKSLLDELEGGATNGAAVEAAFAKVDWEEFEKALRSHVDKL